ncbi:MAG: hypothetical protein V4553_16905 [Bacteroidota bacterium]
MSRNPTHDPLEKNTSVKKKWAKPEIYILDTVIEKGPQATHEAQLMPTHTNGGVHYSKLGNIISTLGHYVS